MNRLRIKIGVVGCVSVGKTTLVNSIFGCQYSDTEIHRTTFIPQTYNETRIIEENFDSERDSEIISRINSIKTANRKSNQMIPEAFQIGSVAFPIHNVPRISEFINHIAPNNDILFSVTDYPGIEKLNGPYRDLVKEHMQSMDIIIFMSDLSRALMTMDEINVLNFLLGLLSKNNSRIICLLNKCDHIYHDEKQNDLVFTDSEQERIFIRANNILNELMKTSNISRDRCTPFIPIASEIAFIYRAIRKYPNIPLDETYINKLCIYEYGSNQWKKNYENIRNMTPNQIMNLFNDETNCSQKIIDSGFNVFETIIQHIIDTYGKEFFMHKVNSIISNLSSKTIVSSNDIISFINENYDFVKMCDDIYKCQLMDTFWSAIKNILQKYINYIRNINVNIIIDHQLISFNDFDNIHTNLQTECLYFKNLIETIKKHNGEVKDIIEPPEFCMCKAHQNSAGSACRVATSEPPGALAPLEPTVSYQILTNKICVLYEQLITYSDGMDRHTHFSNILQYLSVVHEFLPENFDKLSVKFLDVFSKKIKMILDNQPTNKEHETKLIEVIDYIYNNISDTTLLYKKLTYMLILKHMYMINHFPADAYWYHMVMLKNYIKRNRLNTPPKSKYFVDIIYEITTKYIRDQLTDKSMFNIYRQEINMDLVSALLRTPDKYDLTQLNPFEQKIMDILFKS